MNLIAIEKKKKKKKEKTFLKTFLNTEQPDFLIL